MGGFNNNPTCRQFISAYKKIVTFVHCMASSSANCKQQDETRILNISSSNFEANIETNDILEEFFQGT